MDIYSIQTLFPDGNFLSNQPLLTAIKELNSKGQVSTIKYKNRLDLLSYDLYNTVELWWLLGIYNEIQNPMSFDNQLLNYPDKGDITDLLRRYAPDES